MKFIFSLYTLLSLTKSIFSSDNLKPDDQGLSTRDVAHYKQKLCHKNLQYDPSFSISYPKQFFHSSVSTDWRKNAVFDDTLSRQKKSEWQSIARAQFREDVYLYENYFYGMRNGVIVESGALDGMRYSTSYMFEKFANWTAIHVEGDTYNYCGLKYNRPDAINIHAALCSESRQLHYLHHPENTVRGFYEFMSDAFVNKWYPKYDREKVTPELLNQLPTVQCVRLQSLFKELHITEIDIWILDTEGAEESILRGTDFKTLRINVIAMECNPIDGEKNDIKKKLITEYGYNCDVYYQKSCICVHNSYKPSTIKT